jgi:hypothetical protein
MKIKLNVKLLRKIQRHITEEPRRLYMKWFIRAGRANEFFDADNNTKQMFPECGTAACIFGWANLLTKGRDAGDYNRAVIHLGLEPHGDDFLVPYAYLSDVPYWPEPFKTHYQEARTPKTRAKIACARIDYLIETGQ